MVRATKSCRGVGIVLRGLEQGFSQSREQWPRHRKPRPRKTGAREGNELTRNKCESITVTRERALWNNLAR